MIKLQKKILALKMKKKLRNLGKGFNLATH
jgi:hypothetical protein